MVKFNLGQLVFDEIVKNATKVHPRYMLSFPSLIFQILHNPRIVRATEQFKKPMPKLKFSHKWLKGKHAINDQEKEATDAYSDDVEKEEASQTQKVPTASSPKVIPTSIRQRMIDELSSYFELNERQVDSLPTLS
ncbi:hypothetical protein J1N35_004497 [Gossypium stocksii]|uniref:Uncharacterized protein n=1 Tax=Gossypium stocksii TaxID=47602 RepID=A0A9D4AG52_9ROSI|nr:hypothetical protein J1N35_004497 [Gossypium stocksii]